MRQDETSDTAVTRLWHDCRADAMPQLDLRSLAALPDGGNGSSHCSSCRGTQFREAREVHSFQNFNIFNIFNSESYQIQSNPLNLKQNLRQTKLMAPDRNRTALLFDSWTRGLLAGCLLVFLVFGRTSWAATAFLGPWRRHAGSKRWTSSSSCPQKTGAQTPFLVSWLLDQEGGVNFVSYHALTSFYAVKLFESLSKLFAHKTHSTKFFEWARSRLHGPSECQQKEFNENCTRLLRSLWAKHSQAVL